MSGDEAQEREDPLKQALRLLGEYTQEPLTKDVFNEFKKWVDRHKELTRKERDSFCDDNVTINVFDCKVDARGPDDKIYGSTGRGHDRIRKEVTRGCVLLEVQKKGSDDKEYIIYQGFAKFTGLTDEDDDDLAAMSERSGEGGSGIQKDLFFHERRDVADKIVSCTKENGKAAHFGCFKVRRRRYYVAGSKNVHVVFRNAKDLRQVKNQSMLHVTVARIMLDVLKRMDAGKKEEYLEMLCSTGMFANFEMMLKEDQHIVDYTFDDVPAAEEEGEAAPPAASESGDDRGKKFPSYVLRFLSFSGRRTANEPYIEKYGKVFPVHLSAAAGAYYGLDCTVFREWEASPSQLGQIVKEIRGQDNTEGSVLYFLRGLRTIGLCKAKSVWYVFFRAIREKLKRRMNNFNAAIKQRFENIQTWLNVTDDEIKTWRVLAYKFHLYVHGRVTKAGDHRDQVNAIRLGYADHVRDFLASEWKVPADLDAAIAEIEDTELWERKVKGGRRGRGRGRYRGGKKGKGGRPKRKR